MIPVAFDMSGPTSGSFIDSIKPAWEDYWGAINEQGGILGRKVEWRIYDDKQSPAEGAQVWKRMVSDFPNAPLIHIEGSGVRVSIKPQAGEDKKVAIGTGNTFEVVSPPGWVFATHNVYDDMVATALERYFLPQWKESRPLRFAFVTQDAAWAKAIENVIPYLKKLPNLEVLPTEYTPAVPVDLTAQMTRLKEGGADVVWVQHVEAGMAPVLREAQRMGLKDKIKWITGHSVDAGTLFPLVGDNIAGLYQVSPTASPYSDASQPGVKFMNDVFKAKHPNAKFLPGTMYSGEVMAAMLARAAIEQAVQKVGSWDKLTGDVLYDTYQSLKVDTQGLTGTLTYDKTKRWAVDYNKITQFNAAGENKAISDWLPVSRSFQVKAQ